MNVKWTHLFKLCGFILTLEIKFQNISEKSQIEAGLMLFTSNIWEMTWRRIPWWITGNLLSQSRVKFLPSSCRSWIKITLYYPLGKGLALSCSPTQGPCRACFSAETTESGMNPGSATLMEGYSLKVCDHIINKIVCECQHKRMLLERNIWVEILIHWCQSLLLWHFQNKLILFLMVDHSIFCFIVYICEKSWRNSFFTKNGLEETNGIK